jgi:hypothetical protein
LFKGYKELIKGTEVKCIKLQLPILGEILRLRGNNNVSILLFAKRKSSLLSNNHQYQLVDLILITIAVHKYLYQLDSKGYLERFKSPIVMLATIQGIGIVALFPG